MTVALNSVFFSPPGDAEANVEVSMPDVVEAEIGETAVINCEFSLPENSSYAYIHWFSVSQKNQLFGVGRWKKCWFP